MTLIYFKDRFLKESECHISFHDRSFRFGDGMFETMLVSRGRIYDFAGHEARLKAGLEALCIRLPGMDSLQAVCEETVRCNNVTQGYVRVIISRGAETDGAGYLPGSAQPYFIVHAFARSYPAFKEISLWQYSQNAAFHMPAKTNSALMYVLAMMEARGNGCGNALLSNAEGYISETASGNIFWIQGDTLYTPALDLPLVPGTIRSRIMALWGRKIKEGYFTVKDLITADEIFMTNTGCIIAPVVAVKPVGLTLQPGAETGRLRELMDAEIGGLSSFI